MKYFSHVGGIAAHVAGEEFIEMFVVTRSTRSFFTFPIAKPSHAFINQ